MIQDLLRFLFKKRHSESEGVVWGRKDHCAVGCEAGLVRLMATAAAFSLLGGVGGYGVGWLAGFDACLSMVQGVVAR